MLAAFAGLLARRYLLTRWVNVLAICGVALAVWAMIVVIAVFSGFIGGIRDDVHGATPDLLLTDLPHDQSFERIAPVLADADVEAIAPRLRHYGAFYLHRRGLIEQTESVNFQGMGPSFVQILGVDPELEPQVLPLRRWFRHAAPMQLTPAQEQSGRRRAGLPVSATVRDRAEWAGIGLSGLKVQHQPDLQPGDCIDLVTAHATAAGVTPVQARFGFAGDYDSGFDLFDDGTALVPIESLRSMLGHDMADGAAIDLVTDIAIRVRPGADLAATAARLERKVRDGLPELRDCRVLTWEEQYPVFLGAVELERSMMKLVLGAVMLLASFLIYMTLHMLVTQKVKDIGILCALGGAPGPVGSIFVWSGLCVGTVGAGLGVSTGILSVHLMNPVNHWLDRTFGFSMFPRGQYGIDEVPFRLEGDWIVLVAALALFLSLLVAWLPARRAARLDPVTALSYE